MSDRCRDCGAPLRWVVNARTGKRMPLDEMPVENGNVIIASDGQAYVVARHSVPGPAYTNHHATCTKARWRQTARRFPMSRRPD